MLISLLLLSDFLSCILNSGTIYVIVHVGHILDFVACVHYVHNNYSCLSSSTHYLHNACMLTFAMHDY